MKFPDPKSFFITILLLAVAASCTPAKNKDSSEIKVKNDTASTATSLKGKVVFRIRNPDFFTNIKGKKINSVDEFRNYIPVFFYEKNGEFYISNRIDNIIYKTNSSGNVVEKIPLSGEIDLAHFYITNTGDKYILNHEGLTVFNGKNQKIREDSKVIFMTPDFSNDNLLITIRQGNQDNGTPYTDKIFERFDIKKIMREPFIDKAHHCDYYFDNRFLFEMSYENKPKIFIKKYDLHTLNLISNDSTTLNCRSCFDMPLLLSEQLVVASNFSDQGNPINELFLFSDSGYKKFELVPPALKEEPLNDVMYIGRMPLNYCFSLDKEKKKLYSLATTEKEVVVIEYPLPEAR